MTTQAKSRRLSLLDSFVLAASIAVTLVGGVVLVGWISDIATLKSILPALPKMMPNTSLLFVLAGMSLWLLRAGPPRSKIQDRWHLIGQVGGFTVALVSLLTLAEYYPGWDLGIDQLLFKDTLVSLGTSIPGRPSPHTALSFLLVGLALMLLDVETHRGHRPAQFLALGAVLVAMLALAGYPYDVRPFYGISTYTGMAVHTALAFIVLGAGVLFARPDRGLMAVVTSDSSGGYVARRLLPAAIGVPLIGGWIILEGQRADLYGGELALALFVTVNLIFLPLLIWWYARSLDRANAERKQVEEALRESEARTRKIFEYSNDAIFLVDPARDEILDVNPVACRTLGYSREELLTLPLSGIHPQQMPMLQAFAKTVYEAGQGWTNELSCITKGGELLPVEVSASTVELDGRLLMISIVRDITERKRAEQEVRFLATVTLAINECKDFQSAIEVVLREVCTFTDWRYGEAWVPSPDGAVLELSPAWYGSGDALAGFRVSSDEFTFPPGSGLPGRVWSTKQPEWLPDVSAVPETLFPRAHIARQSGIKASLGVPVVANGQVLAVLVFFMTQFREEDQYLVEIISGTAMQLGLAIQRKRAEEALRESEGLLADVLGLAPVAIVSIGKAQDIRLFNRGAEEMFGYRADEAMGRPLDILIPPNLVKSHRGHVQAFGDLPVGMLRAGSRDTLSGRRKDGTEFPAEISISKVQRQGEDIFIAIVRDITERKWAEEALRESEAHYRNIFEHSNDAILIIDPERDEIREANSKASSMLGYSHDELLRTPVSAIHPNEMSRLRTFAQAVSERGQAETDQLRCTTKSGHLLPVEISASPITVAGNPYMVAVVRDITERKLAEEVLRRSHDEVSRRVEERTAELSRANTLLKREIAERLQAEEALRREKAQVEMILDSVADGVYVIGLDSTVALWNSSAERLTGWTSSQVIGQRCADFLACKDDHGSLVCDTPRCPLTAVLDSGNPSSSKGGIACTADGRGIPLSVNAAPVKDEEGNIMGLVLAIRDISAEVEVEQMKSQLLSTVSHELRTPLAIIKGYSTMLLDYDKVLPFNEKREILKSIDTASDRLTDLVDHLLDMSRLEAGLLLLDMSPARVDGLMHDAVAEAQLRAPEHQLRAEVNGALPVVTADLRRIRQVLDNLLDNAIKYSEKRTEIVVRGERKGQELEITVTDQGMGIPAAETDKVFDRMYRLKERLVEDPGGMGLGLSLCKALVEAHGGRIWLESREGAGTTVHFTLPVASEEKVNDSEKTP